MLYASIFMVRLLQRSLVFFQFPSYGISYIPLIMIKQKKKENNSFTIADYIFICWYFSHKGIRQGFHKNHESPLSGTCCIRYSCSMHLEWSIIWYFCQFVSLAVSDAFWGSDPDILLCISTNLADSGNPMVYGIQCLLKAA